MCLQISSFFFKKLLYSYSILFLNSNFSIGFFSLFLILFLTPLFILNINKESKSEINKFFLLFIISNNNGFDIKFSVNNLFNILINILSIKNLLEKFCSIIFKIDFFILK